MGKTILQLLLTFSTSGRTIHFVRTISYTKKKKKTEIFFKTLVKNTLKLISFHTSTVVEDIQTKVIQKSSCYELVKRRNPKY